MSEENQEKFLQKLKNDKKFRFEFIIGIWSGIISLMLVVALVFVTKYFILNDNSIESDDVVEETPVTTTAQAVTVRETDPPYDNAIINGNEEDFDDGEDDGDELKSAEKAYATTVVNVRSEPSLTASVIGKLQKGQEVKIVEFDKEWTKISYNTTEGYVSTIYLSANKPEQEPVASSAPAKVTPKPAKTPKPTKKPTKTQKPAKTPKPTKAPKPTTAPPEPVNTPQPTPEPPKTPEPTPEPPKTPQPTPEPPAPTETSEQTES